MWRRLLYIVASIMIVVLSVIGCSKQQKVGMNKAAETSELSGSNHLKVYLSKGDGYLKDVINDYETRYSEVEVERVIIEKDQEYNETLIKDLMTGKGPDVISFNSGTFDNIAKVMDTGVFSDLNELFNQDRDIDMSQLSKPILEFGQYKEKQLFIPINYSVPLFMTTEKNMADYKEQFTDETTLRQFLSLMERIRRQEEDITILDSEPFAIEAFGSQGIRVYDFKTNEVNFQHSNYKSVMEEYFKICEYANKERPYWDEETEIAKLQSKECIFLYNSIPRISQLMLYESYLKEFGEDGILFNTYPRAEGNDKLAAIPLECMAINSQSSDKENAYNLIKLAISPYYQQNNKLSGFPINKIGLKGKLENNYLINKPIEVNNVRFRIKSLPEEQQNKILKIADSVSYCLWNDLISGWGIFGSIQLVKEEGYTLEEAIEKVEPRIELYLNE